ncbi:hypothetical protein AB0I28_37155 [Phytomonospora sp. NPDC050363]|uniref:hypothetical protein n=1 Tax=Phytomonospora sp. NPDC050363 TaxID=3155642 RepID=UPI0033F63581
MTRTRSRFTTASMATAAGVLMLAGLTACGANGQGSGSGSPAPSDVLSGPTSSDPGPSGSPGVSLPPGKDEPGVDPTKGKSVTITGTVEAGVEHGCLVLNANGKTYSLLGGDKQILTAGTQVEVTGHEAPDVMSFCQQGLPFQVETARAL